MNKTWIALGLSVLFSGGLQAANWGYEGAHGPQHWGEFAPECAKGKNQSPVDVRASVSAELPDLAMHYQGDVVSLTNNGHTLQTGLTGDNILTLDGHTFALRQFHFHTPSENRIDGKPYPLEMHYVHADAQGNLAVVAVFFESGKSNPALADMLAEIPAEGEQVTLAQPFKTSALIPSERGYYRFNGSLTTPPCSEGVRWLVMKQPQTLSKPQLEQLMAVMGENNRPVQAINARLILNQR
ncbi:carbonic anhydrase [Vibrio sp. CAU 1672]|uniref:carbonic anhydrase n=1 Tax=Vibrio sp. CAU 1672 TaxID=3032594 RepID=UPI0023DABDC1|nr:carbonic anhydrase [Vibrio sp. CAU 1672]MDF2152647.1 carbonic anhydrase [Vibrio sp. CAU 1672]